MIDEMMGRAWVENHERFSADVDDLVRRVAMAFGSVLRRTFWLKKTPPSAPMAQI